MKLVKLLILSLAHCSPNHSLLLIINETFGGSSDPEFVLQECCWVLCPPEVDPTCLSPIVWGGWEAGGWRMCRCLNGSQGTTLCVPKLWQWAVILEAPWLGGGSRGRYSLQALPWLASNALWNILCSRVFGKPQCKKDFSGLGHLALFSVGLHNYFCFVYIYILRMPGKCKSKTRGSWCICCFHHTHLSPIL